MIKKKLRRTRSRSLTEGNSETLSVRRAMGDVSVNLSRRVLRYLKVRPGDKLQIAARCGSIEITPLLSVEEEIDKYISH
jgi:hypothetical protein